MTTEKAVVKQEQPVSERFTIAVLAEFKSATGA